MPGWACLQASIWKGDKVKVERVVSRREAADLQSSAVRIFRLGKPLGGPDWFASLVEASKSDLKSPDRSTVPLLAAWRDFSRSLDELSQALNRSLAEPAQLSFEHAVSVAEGKGKSSFTDLMITTAVEAVALEAKYREPEYATVNA